MPLPNSGEIYVPASGEVRDQILTDIRLEAIAQGLSTDPPVQPGTDNYRFAVAFEGPFLLSAQNALIRSTAGDPRFATGQDLLDIRDALGLKEVAGSGSAGRIKLTISGIASVPDGTPLVLSNGKRAVVVGNYSGLVNNSEVNIKCIDIGEDTNEEPGAAVTFPNAPLNVSSTAEVSASIPLSGGADVESESRMRLRIMNRLMFPPAGGNWSQKREIALESLATISDVFVYPALGGPSSELIVPIKSFNLELYDFTKAVNTNALSIVRSALHTEFESPDEIVVKAAVEEPVDVSLELTIPESTFSGGNGSGWVDNVVWPNLLVGDSGRVSVTAVTSNTNITVSANTTTSPVAGLTHIVWHSKYTQKFYKRIIQTVSGSAGAWVLTFVTPLVDDLGNDVEIGDYISPDAVNIEEYAKTWLTLMDQLGPAEATNDSNRLPRSKRHPYISGDVRSSDLKPSKLSLFSQNHKEIEDYEYGFRSLTTPTIPASVSIAPSIFVPRRFGIYKG